MHARIIAISTGEPAGIGPDVCVQIAAATSRERLVFLGDPDVLQERARRLGLGVNIQTHERAQQVGAHVAGTMATIPVSAAVKVEPGKLNPANAAYVLQILRLGTAFCQSGECDALVTAPVQKSVIVESGVPFTGHTEFLAELTGTGQPVMLLVGPRLRVALATTHVPLRRVPGTLSTDRLIEILRILHAALVERFHIHAPKILVLGLNPHAGEGGTLGTEEREIIEPALSSLRQSGYALTGPVAADTAFTDDALRGHDAVLAMYHDQGLPALKAQSFGEVVNVTLGLPIVRTSVDHGTALAIAGSGRARAASLAAAIELAGRLASP